MGIFSRLFGANSSTTKPRAAVQSSSGGVVISSPEQLEEAIRGANVSASGAVVNDASAMRQAAVFACVRIRSGVPANMPLHIKRRIDGRTREDATEHPLWTIFRRKPNGWQTPSQFKRTMQAWLLLRGNAYARIVWSRGKVIGLLPLHPDRVTPVQLDDMSVVYEYTPRNGRKVRLAQSDVFHLVGLSLDGVTGVSVITYARETIGLSMTMENHGASVFRNAARASHALRHPRELSPDARDHLKASLDEYRAGGANEGKILVLEEGMEVSQLSMSHEDAQWLESRKFSRTDIAMFFGVPPHMIGDTEKSTSWGSGIIEQTQGFIAFTSEDDLTTWEDAIGARLVRDDEPDIYARFNRSALVRGDLKSRYEAHSLGRQMGVLSANDVRALEDMNPVEGGDVYENPMITPNKETQQ